MMLLSGLIFATDKTFANSSNFIDQSNDIKFLTPDEAFKLSINYQNGSVLRADFKIADSHYLYRNRIKFDIPDTAVKIQSVELPDGDIKSDPNFGKTEVYHHDFQAIIKLVSLSKDTNKINLVATYQGCSEKGLCYAPITKSFPIQFVPLSSTKIETPPLAVEENQATLLLKGGKFWLISIGFFGFGLLLALTPCVLPMIPILSGIIVGDKKIHHHHTSRMHSFYLSLSYTLGMSLSYTLAGIAAGFSGQLLSNALQNIWVLGLTALIFVFLAFSMFGFYELRLPSKLESKMVKASNRFKGGQFLGVFIMGIISALIVSPCVAAPLAGALLYISQSHNVLIGGIALFSLSIGMGMPLLLIGASAGHVLPKAGEWMQSVRHFFGVLMLAVAIWIISPLINISIQMGLWSSLFIIPAIYLRALDGLNSDANNWARLWKGFGIILLVIGVSLLIGALSGSKSPYSPLSELRIRNDQVEDSLNFMRVGSQSELDKQISVSNGKIVALDFYADWCVACKEMERITFSDPNVKKALINTVMIQVDVTDNSPEKIALLKKYNLFGPPGIIFFNKSGQEIHNLRVVGFQDPVKFLDVLNRVNSLNAEECNPLIVC